MMRRQMTRNGSKRLFAATAGSRNVHSKNYRNAPMRGGIRL